MRHVAPPQVPPSITTLVGILNFRLSPSTISGVAPVQALSQVERATIAAIQQYPKDQLKQIVRFLADGNPVENVFKTVKFPNEPDLDLLMRLHQEVSRSGLTDILIYGVYHEIFAWVAADTRDPIFFVTSIKLLRSFLSRGDPLELNLVARLLIGAFLNDPTLHLTEPIHTSIVGFLDSSRKLSADFAPVFNKLAVKVLEELPAIQQPFL
jgi:hypothetical protein